MRSNVCQPDCSSARGVPPRARAANLEFVLSEERDTCVARSSARKAAHAWTCRMQRTTMHVKRRPERAGGGTCRQDSTAGSGWAVAERAGGGSAVQDSTAGSGSAAVPSALGGAQPRAEDAVRLTSAGCPAVAGGCVCATWEAGDVLDALGVFLGIRPRFSRCSPPSSPRSSRSPAARNQGSEFVLSRLRQWSRGWPHWPATPRFQAQQQGGSASLTGVVTDELGGVLPGVTITAVELRRRPDAGDGQRRRGALRHRRVAGRNLRSGGGADRVPGTGGDRRGGGGRRAGRPDARPSRRWPRR